MISTLDPRLSHTTRAELHRLLKPGEAIRRPKLQAAPSPEELRRRYLALLVEGKSDWAACRILARKYGRHPDGIRRRIRRFSKTENIHESTGAPG